MPYKYFVSKIGMLFAGAYLLSVIGLVIFAIVLGPPDLSMLVLMILAMPWSFILSEALRVISFPLTIVGFALWTFCIFLNAAILYFLGFLLSILGKRINRQNESTSKTP